MKISESWLREWVSPELDSNALAHRLTMLGHEVDAVSVEGEGLDGVVVGEILSFNKHPDADRLNVCQVSTGDETHEIVCGAPNVRVGMKSPLALPGVTLPNGLKLRKSKIRGVVSNGMLCSAVELGLGDESDGIMDLPADMEAGSAFAAALGLPDTIIEVDLTPNRGDCFSVLGIARDVAALTGAALKDAEYPPVSPGIDDVHEVVVRDPAHCPSFAGRVIRGIDAKAKSPLWLREKLRRAGLRPIHPVVDVTNLVMLELGQPCHAYDLDLVSGPIAPRMAKAGEKLVLLVDEKEITLNDDTLVIADDSGPIGLAGIMGGLSTAVSSSTVNVFFEAAFWPQEIMAGRARSYGLHTDASLRFERGVDPRQQLRAVEYATRLILDICGGEAGPTVHDVVEEQLPARPPVTLRRSRLERVLGATIADDEVAGILGGLGLAVAATDDGWIVTPPSHRFDISIEADLIEEVARIHGYDALPEATAVATLPLAESTESRVPEERIADSLVARDYREAITYSFIDAAADERFTGRSSELRLSNPISSEMSVMRGSQLPGLVDAVAGNLSRQQSRVRLFEIGRSYHGNASAPSEVLRLSGAVAGSRFPEQWGTPTETVDFFDIKADIEALLALTGQAEEFRFAAAEHVAMQPGQTAAVMRGDELVGHVGKLHPSVAKAAGIKQSVFVFELDVDKAFAAQAATAGSISRFPAIRRDIAVIVDESVTAAELVTTIRSAAPQLVREVRVFDIYRGNAIEAGRKSVAIGLILQETSRTLIDDDADAATALALQKLQQEHAAELRD